MRTLTICGSMRFAEEMQKIAFELEALLGYNVLQCTYSTPETELSSQMLDNTDKAHYRKIDLSDAVYVVDPGGYIGESTRKEI